MAGLIVLEGIDGSGKSTVAKALAEHLGDRAVLTREPTDSWIGRAVKEGDGREVSPYVDALLFMADRAQHTLEMAELVRKGKTVVCDRYYHSTVAYQTASLRRKGLGDNFGWLLDSNTRISLKPDITFLLVLPPESMPGRISDRSERSRFERLDFLREVASNYDRLAAGDKGIVTIDATMPLESVVKKVLATVKERNI
jgi:dTMP kinase